MKKIFRYSSAYLIDDSTSYLQMRHQLILIKMKSLDLSNFVQQLAFVEGVEDLPCPLLSATRAQTEVFSDSKLDSKLSIASRDLEPCSLYSLSQGWGTKRRGDYRYGM